MDSATAKLDLLGYPIDLTESVDDSPMFRKKLNNQEEITTEFSTALKAYTKGLRNSVQTAQAHSQAISSMATESIILGRNKAVICPAGSDSLDFEEAIQSFASIIQLGENLRSSMFKMFEEQGIKSMENLQDDIKEIKEGCKKWGRLSSQADASSVKMAQLKKNSNKIEESEVELMENKKQQAQAALEVSAKINQLTAKSRLDILDSLYTYLELQKEFVYNYQNLIQSHLGELKGYRAKINMHNEMLPTSVAAIESFTSCAPESATLRSNQKGYLFRNTKLKFTRRNYFIVKDGVLYCYENLDTLEPKWNLDMVICSVKPSSEASRNYCFDVISPYKSYTLQAETQESMNKWMSVLQEAISLQLDKQRLGAGSSDTNMSKSGRSASLSAMGSPTTLAADEAKKREETMQTLYTADPQNKLCADCKDANPTWVSINLGILICLECSGIHRSMGTHISKVRSLTLDKLSTDTTNYLLAMGNAKCNDIYDSDNNEAIPTSLGIRISVRSNRKD